MQKRTTIRLPTTGENHPIPANYDNWICPNIRPYWKLARSPQSDQIILSTLEGNRQHLFSPPEGHALRYFTGQFTVKQAQQACQQNIKDAVPPNLVAQLLQKLMALEIIALKEAPENLAKPKNQENLPIPNRSSSPLKTCLQWISHPDGYWLLRNPENVTFLQVSDRDKGIIEQLGVRSLSAIAQEFSITQDELRQLLQKLAATAMLEGTQPPKPRRRKFTPMQLLFFKIPLFNPDSWLTQHIDKLRFLYSRTFAFFLCLFLAFSLVLGLHQHLEILYQGQQLWQHYSASLIIPFILLTALVVTLHELGHAFTLKQYGGIVPEMGFLFMCLFPAAYTNTTDSYCLSRRQRILVVGAGILVQITLAAIALWLWNLSTTGNWLYTTSYLLMIASLFTIALNLNPLAKFDGYYLAVAITGINNLRNRAFSFYAHLLTGQPINETRRDSWILAAYAPLSLAYIWFVFGFLFLRITDWILLNIPTTALLLLLIWAIYFYFPRKSSVATGNR